MDGLLRRTLTADTLKCIDVGARGGVQRGWLPFKALMETECFEPEPVACEKEKAANRPGRTLVCRRPRRQEALWFLEAMH
jgi:hypothetical protein